MSGIRSHFLYSFRERETARETDGEEETDGETARQIDGEKGKQSETETDREKDRE